VLVSIRRLPSLAEGSLRKSGIATRLSLLLLLCAHAALFAQSVQISSATASHGNRVTLQVSLTSPRGYEPVALQWETTYPGNQLTPVADGVWLGPVARKAGKVVKCAPKAKSSETSGAKCILIGGQQQIPNGVVAFLEFRVLPDAPKGPAHVQMDHGMAVFKNLAHASFNVAEGVIKIRSK